MGELCHPWEQSAILLYGVVRMRGVLRVQVENWAGISCNEWPIGQLRRVKGFQQ